MGKKNIYTLRGFVKGKENGKHNEKGFDNLHILLLIHVYALAKIRQVKSKRPVEKYAW